jgi:hypothetical protein
MNTSNRKLWIFCGLSALSTAALLSCGQEGNPVNDESSTQSIGNFNFSCGGEASQNQVKFQQQQQSGCGGQKLAFQKSKISDFDMDLDCKNKVVQIKNRSNEAGAQQAAILPIQRDGSVKGKIDFPQQIQSDQKGNQVCWIEMVATFDGKADCENSHDSQHGDMRSTHEATSVKSKLTISTQVSFAPTNPTRLQSAGVAGYGGPGGSTHAVEVAGTPPSPIETTPSPFASVSPSTLPSIVPSILPSSFPSTTPSVSPSVAPTPSPSMQPHPSATPVVICAVEDPCPMYANSEMSCSE